MGNHADCGCEQFAKSQAGESLTHTAPRGRDAFTPSDGATAYPFPILEEGSASEMTLRLLKDHDLVYTYLVTFQTHAHSCYFPDLPNDGSLSEFQRFLADAEANAIKHPDMLAVIFATMAAGLQVGVWSECGGQLNSASVYKARMCGDVYSEHFTEPQITPNANQSLISGRGNASVTTRLIHEHTNIACRTSSRYHRSLLDQ
jgi:hypothetical protein